MGNNMIYLNKKNAFHIMANLYIIRYMYSHMIKAECFMEKSSRKKSKDFYKFIGMSCRRISNILNGYNFILKTKEIESLCNMFDVEEDYFTLKGKLMTIRELDEIDWKCFFNQKHEVGFEINLPKKVVAERASKVTETLYNMLKTGKVEAEYDINSPVYRIWYYFKHGYTYKEENNLSRFLKALSNLKISDWNEIEEDLEKMKFYGKMLEKHTNYVNAALLYKTEKRNS